MVMPIASTVTIISAISGTVISIVTSVISGCTFVPRSSAVIFAIPSSLLPHHRHPNQTSSHA
ncbi:MAG: hypothetical protein Q8P67_22975 [archaeon]|nr:hypothetical protein [archaeon]